MADFSWERRVRILEKFHYGSPTKEQPFKRWRPKRGLTMEKYEKEIGLLGKAGPANWPQIAARCPAPERAVIRAAQSFTRSAKKPQPGRARAMGEGL